MTARIYRLALAAAVALTVTERPAEAAAPITHTQFIEAYVACNNAAWEGKPRGQILTIKEPTMSDRMRGIDSATVRAFVGENLYFDGVYGNVLPRANATVGWALATKAFADRGEIEPQFRTPDAAVAYLRAHGLVGTAALADREAGAIATEIDLSSQGAGQYAITSIPAGTRLGDPLDRATARPMFAKIGTHFDVGRRTMAKPGRACPARILRTLFR